MASVDKNTTTTNNDNDNDNDKKKKLKCYGSLRIESNDLKSKALLTKLQKNRDSGEIWENIYVDGDWEGKKDRERMGMAIMKEIFTNNHVKHLWIEDDENNKDKYKNQSSPICQSVSHYLPLSNSMELLYMTDTFFSSKVVNRLASNFEKSGRNSSTVKQLLLCYCKFQHEDTHIKLAEVIRRHIAPSLTAFTFAEPLGMSDVQIAQFLSPILTGETYGPTSPPATAAAVTDVDAALMAKTSPSPSPFSTTKALTVAIDVNSVAKTVPILAKWLRRKGPQGETVSSSPTALYFKVTTVDAEESGDDDDDSDDDDGDKKMKANNGDKKMKVTKEISFGNEFIHALLPEEEKEEFPTTFVNLELVFPPCSSYTIPVIECKQLLSSLLKLCQPKQEGGDGQLKVLNLSNMNFSGSLAPYMAKFLSSIGTPAKGNKKSSSTATKKKKREENTSAKTHGQEDNEEEPMMMEVDLPSSPPSLRPPTSRVETLTLSNCHLTDKCLRALATQLPFLPHLSELDLSGQQKFSYKCINQYLLPSIQSLVELEEVKLESVDTFDTQARFNLLCDVNRAGKRFLLGVKKQREEHGQTNSGNNNSNDNKKYPTSLWPLILHRIGSTMELEEDIHALEFDKLEEEQMRIGMMKQYLWERGQRGCNPNPITKEEVAAAAAAINEGNNDLCLQGFWADPVYHETEQTRRLSTLYYFLLNGSIHWQTGE